MINTFSVKFYKLICYSMTSYHHSFIVGYMTAAKTHPLPTRNELFKDLGHSNSSTVTHILPSKPSRQINGWVGGGWVDEWMSGWMQGQDGIQVVKIYTSTLVDKEPSL